MHHLVANLNPETIENIDLEANLTFLSFPHRQIWIRSIRIKKEYQKIVDLWYAFSVWQLIDEGDMMLSTSMSLCFTNSNIREYSWGGIRNICVCVVVFQCKCCIPSFRQSTCAPLCPCVLSLHVKLIHAPAATLGYSIHLPSSHSFNKPWSFVCSN